MGKRIEYSIIIEMDVNALPFEREMCAFITSKYADDGYGEEEAKIAIKQLSKSAVQIFDSLIEYRSSPGDSYEWPCDTILRKGQLALEIYLTECPQKKTLKLMVSRAKKYCKLNKIKYIESILVRTATEITIEETPC